MSIAYPVYLNRCAGCIFLSLVLMPIQGCARTYSAKPIEALVVDAETGRPVEGANVVANWELNFGLEGGGAYQLQIMEEVTDKNGRFYFPAWGPKKIPGHLPSEARLKDRDPAIIIFKSGYASKGIQNERPIGSMGGHGQSIRTSEWNGKVIQLRPFHGDDKAYVLNMRNAQSWWMEKDCNWKLLPRMVLAWEKELQVLKRKNIPVDALYIFSIDGLSRQTGCGSAGAFLKVYEQ